MSHFTFLIPENTEELLSTATDDEYRVHTVSGTKQLPSELKNYRASFRDEGIEYIIDAFNSYFSVLHHGDELPIDVIFTAYEDLQRATSELNKALGFLLEDKDGINDEIKTKYTNITKMTIYLFTQIVLLLEKRTASKNENRLVKSKKQTKDIEDFTINKSIIVLNLNNIIQRDLSVFWEPMEENFVTLISSVCYVFLRSETIKRDKQNFLEIFNLLGTLIKDYHHGCIFTTRITNLVRIHEHFAQCLPNGIQHLVEKFNFKGLLHDLIEELTEWQTDEKHQDNQGARNCSSVLCSLAALMPKLMMPEVMFLNGYLYHSSSTLRISVITVMFEVILNNLTSHELNDEQKQFRDSLFEILIEHTEDTANTVRAKVFSHFTRLQKEMAIPLKFQLRILKIVAEHLLDKSPIVRKFSASGVTTFLSCNSFGANLSLASMKQELEQTKEKFETMKNQINDPKMDQLMELQSRWDQIVLPLKTVVDNELEKGKENGNENTVDRAALENLPDIIRMYLEEKQYKEAFRLIQQALTDHSFLERFKQQSSQDDNDFYMNILYTVFFDVPKVVNEMNEFRNITEDDYQKLETLSKEYDFLKQCVQFLEIIDSIMDVMKELLETTSVTDMNEAIEFFTAAYRFNIDRAPEGILAILRLMQRSEQERKDAVVTAFKNIYILSDSNNLTDHCTVVVHRLLRLVKTLPIDSLSDLEGIISNWVLQGTLDNSIIDMLFKMFIQSILVTEEDEIAVVELLRMAAVGRKTISSRNINLVASKAFAERGKNNMQFLAACCRFIAESFEKNDINSADPPFKIKAEEQCFTDLANILGEHFFMTTPFYSQAMYGGIDFVYKMSSKPDLFSEQVFSLIVPKLVKKQTEDPNYEVPIYSLIRLCQISGYIALKHLEFMDNTVYKELKRRQNVRDATQKKKSTDNHKKKKKARASNTASEASSLNISMAEDVTMEGAQAEDTDAELILQVLELNTVTGSGYLAKMAPIIVKVCERQDLYASPEIQFAGVTALSRFMLVSSIFCKKHVRLLFTIFEKTTFPDLKGAILIHVSDLLVRFPNIIEPWTDKLFLSLKAQEPRTRRLTFFTLSRLILNDMIRAHSHISKMAACLADEDEELKSTCKTFFLKLSHKENNLFNALPDIFSHFIEEKIGDDETIKDCMGSLFDMVENTKHLEGIVVRFCSKFALTEDIVQHRHISFCLSLIKYNAKALQKLIEEFPVYKHLVHDADIYANFRTIIQNSSKDIVGKADLKPLATELEELIASVFQVRGDGEMPPPPPPKSVRKRGPKKVASKKKKPQRRNSDDSD